MHDRPSPETGGERLESWKEIAAYLKRDVRTARRWEKHEGLPVHRHVHHKLASVYAFRPELDEWRAAREAAAAAAPPATDPAPTRRWGAIAIGAAASLGIALVIVIARVPTRPSRPPRAPITQARIPIRGRLLAHATGEGQRATTIQLAYTPGSLALNPAATRLYVADQRGRALHVLDTATNGAIDRIDLGVTPTRLVLDPDGRRLYIGSEEGDILRVDPKGPRLEIVARGLKPANDLALTADGRRLYVAGVFNGLHVVDTGTGDVERITTVGCPMHLALAPQRNLLYVAYQCGGPGGRSGHDAIDVRNAATGQAIATISGAPHVGGAIAASPDGAQIWADGHDACSTPAYDHIGCPKVPGGIVNVYRTDDNYLVGSVGLPGRGVKADSIAFFPDGSRALLTGPGPRIVDVRTLSILEEASFAAGYAVFAPDGRRAYISDPAGAITVFDVGGARCLPPPDSLASWWSGDGHANDVYADRHGQFLDGAAIGPAWIGRGFVLRDGHGRVHVPRVSNVDFSASFGAALWIKPSARGSGGTILQAGAIGRAGWNVGRADGGRVEFCMSGDRASVCRGDQVVRTPAAVSDEVWTHVAVGATGNRLSIYINAELVSTADIAHRPQIEEATEFDIGTPRETGRSFSGSIDEVQLFRRAPTAEEVRQIVGASRHGLCYR